MKRISFFIIAFCYSFFTYSQDQNKIDSLLYLYKNEKNIINKVNSLDAIVDIVLYNNGSLAKKYSLEMIMISEEQNYEKGIMLGNSSLGNYYFTIEQMDSASIYFNNTLKLSKKINDQSIVPQTISNLSIIEAHFGNYAKAMSLMDSVANIYLLNKDYLNYGVSINNNGANFYEQGNYLKAMQNYSLALKILDTIDRDIYRKADLYRNIGKLNNQQENYSSAITYYKKAMTIYREISDNLYLAAVLNDLGNTYGNIENYDEALSNYNESLSIGEKYNYISNSILSYGNIGITYKEMEDYKNAIYYINEALKLEGSQISDINKIIYYYQIGYAYSLDNNFNKAIGYLNEAVSMASKGKIGDELKNALKYRALAYEINNQLKESLADFKKYETLNDSLFNIKKAKQIQQLQTIYETEKKEAAITLQEKEIKTLNQKVEISNLKKGLYAGGMFSFIAISGLVFFGYRQRIKKNKIEREKQEEIYKQEIEHKKKELASQTLHLVQKNTFIQELQENLERLKSNPELFKMEFKRIVMLLRKENASDKDWEVFKSYFVEVNNDFDKKLQSIYPEISEKETRLASLLKMNLSTKEIATMLNVLPDSILKSKYRLKKKLELGKDTDLYQYLSTL